MRRHLYSTFFGRVRWFIQRFGAREMLFKPLRVAFAPLIIPTLPRRTFPFKGRELACFYHRYNMTWANERCLEVPIAMSYLEQTPSDQVLEVGNVLGHYFPLQHTVLDKFEHGQRVINADIVEFAPAQRYDIILSISTLEHVGFDDDAEGSSGKKILAALKVCRRLLTENGLIAFTVPLGYNPQLDQLIREDRLPLSAQWFYRRVSRGEWSACGRDEAMRHQYGTPFPYANAILVGEVRAGDKMEIASADSEDSKRPAAA